MVEPIKQELLYKRCNGLAYTLVDSLEGVRWRAMEWILKLLLSPLLTCNGGLDVCTCTHRCSHPTLLQGSRATQIPLQAPCLFPQRSSFVNVHLPSSHLKIHIKENDWMIFMFYNVPEIPFSCICSHFPGLWKELRIVLLLLNIGLGKVWVLI